MSIETISYISDFNILWPLDTDIKSEGDDHIREVKNGIYGTFSAVAAECRPTHTNLNHLSGLSATVSTRLDLLSASIGDQNNRLAEISADVANISASLTTLSASLAYFESRVYPVYILASSTLSHTIQVLPDDLTATEGGTSATSVVITHNFGTSAYAVHVNATTSPAGVVTKGANTIALRLWSGKMSLLISRNLSRFNVKPTATTLTYTGATPTIT